MKQAEQHETNPQALAAAFLRDYRDSGTYRRDYIERLAELASTDDPETAKEATGAIFVTLVERLADSFEPPAVALYNRIFAHLIQFCRLTPRGQKLDDELTGFGLRTEADLLARAEQLRHVHRLDARRPGSDETTRSDLQRAIVLSRVTVGADIAVTSVVIERLKQEFPTAEIILIGNAKAAEIFGGDPRVRFDEIQYRRAGTLTERLVSWLDVLARVRCAVDGLTKDEYLIVDPDSRLTQLGLLPLAGNLPVIASPPEPSATARAEAKAPIDDSYIFFPSREIGGASEHSLSELTAIWLNAVFGGTKQSMPRLSLRSIDKKRAKALMRRIRKSDSRPVVAINFGIGDNSMKRVSDDFEKQLVSRLLRGGARVILDKGFGEAETARADTVIDEAKRGTTPKGVVKVIEGDEAGLDTIFQEETLDADLFVWSGGLGLLAALIAESNLYIGYDSAGQHIAAALGVPCIDVFAGYSAARMLDRWRPTGKAETRLIAVDTLHGAVNAKAVLETTLAGARAMLK